jgi:hypothetical protein|tara:strand:- start:437 stop:640 length:204 start_codon:yes stop_codon:yes gene_type:complete
MYKLILLFLLLIFSLPSYAYIGPGMGGGIIAATLGIIVAIIAAIFGILYFPIKRFMKNRKKKINEQK